MKKSLLTEGSKTEGKWLFIEASVVMFRGSNFGTGTSCCSRGSPTLGDKINLVLFRLLQLRLKVSPFRLCRLEILEISKVRSNTEEKPSPYK